VPREAPRDRSCGRRERWDRRSFRADARGGWSVDVPTLTAARSRCCHHHAGSVSPRHGVGLTYLHKRGRSIIKFAGGLRRLAPRGECLVRLRGIGPAFAGNVGTGGAFALTREGDQGDDVPTLAADRSRSAWMLLVGDRSCVRRERGERSSFRAERARGIRVMTFQCSLRTDPAAAIAERRGVDGPTQFPFPDDVPRRGRLSAARNLRQGQGGAGGVYPAVLAPPDPTQ
jgi:hypothetical protein